MADKPLTQPVDVPFWSKREGAIARLCSRCGHRGIFEFSEDPVMVSENVVCLSCGSVTFTLVKEDVTAGSVQEIFEEGNDAGLEAVEDPA